MASKSLTIIIECVLFLYIFSLYLFTFRADYNVYSNLIGILLMGLIWLDIVLTNKDLRISQYSLMLIAFVIISLLTYFVALDGGLVFAKSITLVQLLILSISLINYFDNVKKIEHVILYFIFSGFYASIYILLNSNFDTLSRMGGELGNQNEIGMIIAISSIFAFYLIVSELRVVYIPIILVMVGVIILTGSRKAILFLLLNMVMIIFLKNKDSFMKRIKAIVIIIGLMLAAYLIIFNNPIFYDILGDRIEAMFDFVTGKGTSEGSINERTAMITYGIDFWKNRPLLGFGIDNYRALYAIAPSGRDTYSHNNFIEVMVGTGLIGLVIYYLGQGSIIWDMMVIRLRGNREILKYTFIGIIVAYFFIGTSLVYYDSKHFIILMSMASAYTCINTEI